MNNNPPFVTIGIPTYNQEQFIRQAIESALAQDYPNLEIVVSDDASTDGTQEIVTHYLHDPRLKYSRNESNLGMVRNYRRLFYEQASGDWYLNLDGDDYLIDNSFISNGIRNILRYKEQGYDVMFYHSALLEVRPTKTKPHLPNINEDVCLLSGQQYFKDFFKLNASSHLTIICNRIKAMSIDYYSKDTLFTDVDSFLRLSLHGHVILDKRVCAVWRCHNRNASHNVEKSFVTELNTKIEISQYAVPFVGEAVADKWLTIAKIKLMKGLLGRFRFSLPRVKNLLKYTLLIVKRKRNTPFFAFCSSLLFIF